MINKMEQEEGMERKEETKRRGIINRVKRRVVNGEE